MLVYSNIYSWKDRFCEVKWGINGKDKEMANNSAPFLLRNLTRD